MATKAYTEGYEAGETDAAECVRENGSVGDVRPESGLRESERELRARVDELEAADKAWIDSSKYVANMKRRTDDAESALQTSRALCDELRESATAWRGKYYAAAARVEQLEPLIVGERIAKEKLALADAVVEAARTVKPLLMGPEWGYAPVISIAQFSKLDRALAAYDAALKAGDGDGEKYAPRKP